jgi:hypothetical protein
MTGIENSTWEYANVGELGLAVTQMLLTEFRGFESLYSHKNDGHG